MAADLSVRQGWLPAAALARTEDLLQKAGLPTRPPETMDTAQFMTLMAVDKKVVDSGLRLVLLKAIGTAAITGDFSTDQLRTMLDART
jgi:3-dehydroquinate synthase